MNSLRRKLLTATASGACASLALPALASSRRALAAMTDGPFYPPSRWRESGPLKGDWDADLTRVERAGRVQTARGEHLGLLLRLADTKDRVVDNAQIEVWQCDVQAQYRHPSVDLTDGAFDPGFQGFGAARTGADGVVLMRTIRPVAYPGRTPHIHIKLRHASFGEFTSQLFVAGDAGNARDFLWRALPEAQRSGQDMRLQASSGANGLRWTAEHVLVIPA
jgi:protocatechuate 3,4-dioxygenase beta subunit